jgi:tetrapyrrole methylase family protein/MazG family protein
LEAYQLSDLMDIMQKLRGENGCPWDKQQTHQSLKKYLIEECYEAIDALEQNDPQKIAEELGDVLLQIVFHAQLGAEAGTFCMDDVLRAVCEKLISRHPHVFADKHVKDAQEVAVNWSAIKQKEHGIESHTDNLYAVPASLPALMRAQKVQKRAAQAGMDFADIKGAYDKLAEEIQELWDVKDSEDPSKPEEELGDVLFSVVNVARFLDVDCEQALSNSTQKFIRRFAYVEEQAAAKKQKMEQLSFEELDMMWKDSKK